MRKNSSLESDLILTISAQYGLIPQNKFFNKRIASSQIENYYLIKKGEFAYNKSYSAEYPVGAVKQLTLSDKGVLSTLYVMFDIFRSGLNSHWLSAYFESNCWHKEILKRASEGARNHGLLNISAEDFLDIPISLPISESEQQSLATFFDNLDKYISSEDVELQKLKNLKKACLEKMFPKEGERVPEIRFKEFGGEWEKINLGKLFRERVENDEYGELLTVSQSQGVIKASENGRVDNSNKDKSKYLVVKPGDIAYNSMRMWQGASGCSSYYGIVSPAYTILVPDESINSLFFSILFKTDDAIKKFRLNSQGLTSDQWNLRFPAFCKIEITYPTSKEEQTAIANYFTRLDSYISAHEKKVEKLKQLRKGLLEKMFIGNE